jgi:hypothetical protein
MSKDNGLSYPFHGGILTAGGGAVNKIFSDFFSHPDAWRIVGWGQIELVV